MARIVVGFMFCLLTAAGCTEAPPRDRPPAPDGKVRVVAPGVNVDVEPKRDSNSTGKVNVTAPGVQVNVEKK